jgi:phosphoglycerate dehydrogenase-like enzyme
MIRIVEDHMIKGLYLLDKRAFQLIYGPEIRQQIEQWVDIVAPPQTSESLAENPSMLEAVDLIFSGWGCPVFTDDLLAHAPNLKVVFYGAGSIRYLVTEAFWARKILISTAYRANDIPVCEFTLAQIILSLKRYWQHVQRVKETGAWWDHLPVAGAYGTTVGLISLGMIGGMVADRLKTLDVSVLAYDPYVSSDKAAKLGVELRTLEEVFRQSDVVSLHTPWLPETEGMITGAHFASMKEGATFINTARGAIVREDELVSVLKQRSDLYALLDVTWPEPPGSDSPLWTLPNIVITPHIAGSLDRECQRNGQYVVDELKRYLSGEALRYSITSKSVAIMA